MIQGIVLHTYDPVFRREEPEGRNYLLYYEYNRIILIKSGGGSVTPAFRELRAEGDFSAQAKYLFSIGDKAYYCATSMGAPEFGGSYMEPLTVFRNFEPLHQASVGVASNRLYRWTQNGRFCGGCGVKIKPSLKECTLVCPSCGQTKYPKISPTAVVAITNRDKLLMSHYARGACRNYALIIGLVEVGETFEGCVRREVMEETGLKMENIRYCKSQSWAFSGTEMMRFTAELNGDDAVYLGKEELCEAGWFIRDEIAKYRPYIGMGHEMMKAFKDGKTQQTAAYKRRNDYGP